jgi:hypothetical protein
MDRIFILKYIETTAERRNVTNYLYIDSSKESDRKLMQECLDSGECEIYISGNNGLIMSKIFVDLILWEGDGLMRC